MGGGRSREMMAAMEGDMSAEIGMPVRDDRASFSYMEEYMS